MLKRLLFGFHLLVLGVFLAGHSKLSAAAGPTPRVEISSIRVVGGGWGSADLGDIRQVLNLVARQFVAAFGDRAPPPIQVLHRFGTPQVLYDLSPEGEFVVALTARNERWYQYTYQFSHELCHVLSRFERKGRGAEIVRQNQWFEESLCETASLYALRRLAADWAAEPLSARFPGAGLVFGEYADELISQPHRRLPEGVTFPSWFAANRDALRDEPYQREKNELVAAVLLPLFESDPHSWASLAFLNAKEHAQTTTFEGYLDAWRSASPAGLQPFVSRIEDTFGIRARAANGAPAPKSRSTRLPVAEPANGN